MAVCDDERRRHQVRRRELNGIDYLEVSDDQLTLTVFFLAKAPPDLTLANIRIEGGRRVRGIAVTDLRLCVDEEPERDDCIKIVVDRPGDFSTYTLRLVNATPLGRPGDDPLDGFDPRYAQLDFSFKVGCPSDLDCKDAAPCPPTPRTEPAISYLAKDYASFRQLLFDRLALIMPGWNERHVPDIGVALVELLAYTGDHLSYYQDAVATEAYLDTARQRISVRRHARLVDFQLHEGCNARAWVCLQLEGTPAFTLHTGSAQQPASFRLVTGYNDALPSKGPMLEQAELERVAPSRYEVFEPLPLGQLTIYEAHNRIAFYTWGDRECCLPKGTSSATLRDAWSEPEGDTRELKLQAGDVLIFEELIGPRSGAAADADPAHRHAVRLTQVEPGVDTLYNEDDPRGIPLLEIAWEAADALPFPLCISALADGAHGCVFLENVSVARGNLVLADHGRTLIEPLPEVPAQKALDAGCLAEGEPRETPPRAARYRPRLRHGPLAHRTPFPAPPEVARRQAELLRAIPAQVRRRLEEILGIVQAGTQLDGPLLAELRTLFGTRALETVRLLRQGSAPPRPLPASEQARALRRLLADQETLLARKLGRLATLAARAESGDLLDTAVQHEIAEQFGARYAEGLEPGSSAHFGPAAAATAQEPLEALPAIWLAETGSAARWQAHSDLLASAPGARHVVAEIENDGRARLRFGDGASGLAPTPATALVAHYRVGGGKAGNVGAEAINRIVLLGEKLSGATIRPRNPLPARGGIDPQPLAEARLLAPGAFRTSLRRAVTAEDYARLAEQDPRVQRAAALLRWTGSWYQAEVTVDPLGSLEASPALLDAIARRLHPYRRIGHDLVVRPARYVPLVLEMIVCLLPSYQRAQVAGELRALFSTRELPGGARGFFHPDRLTFGKSIYVSELVAAAMAVPGVELAQITLLERLYEAPESPRPYEGPDKNLSNGVLPIAPDEIARLDNNLNQPENGTLKLTLRGGR